MVTHFNIGLAYPQMVILTYFAYYIRLTSLSTFSAVDKFLKLIPIIAILQIIPDLILYIFSAWVSSEDPNYDSQQLAIETEQAFAGVVFLITFLTYYAILLKKMFGFLTVSKKKVFAKVATIVSILTAVDILLIVSNFMNRELYNSVYSLSYTVKLVAVIELFDEDSWM